MSRNLFARQILTFAIAFGFLAGCGGGGGGGDGGSSPGALPLSTQNLTFSANAGAGNPPSQSVGITFTSSDVYSVVAGRTASQPSPSWVYYAINTSGTADATLVASISTTALPAGTYTDRLIIQTRRLDDSVIAQSELTISYTVSDPLNVSETVMEFNAADGAPAVPSQTARLSRYGTSGNWSASANQTWLGLNATGGTVPANLTVTPDISSLAVGSHAATVTITDALDGTTQQIAVTVNIEPHKLFVSDIGVALTSMPSLSRLSHAVVVSDNGGAPVAWSASSNQSWLSVTPTGNTGESLTLTADPAGLGADTIHYATVTITSAASTITNSATAQVGLYVRSTDPDPADRMLSSLPSPNVGTGLESDPIRPYVYVTNADNSIQIYNVHDASLVGTITGATGSDFRDMAVSDDGAVLYVLDRSNSTILPVDLATSTIGTAWTGFTVPSCASSPASCMFALAYTRPNGHPVLLTGGRQIIDAATGAIRGTLSGTTTVSDYLMLAAAPDGGAVYAKRANGLYSNLIRYQLRYSDVHSSPVAAFETEAYNVGGLEYATDLVVSADSRKIYTASNLNSQYEVRAYSADPLSLLTQVPTASHNQSIAIGPTGRVYVGSGSNSNNLLAYDPGLTNIATLSASYSLIVRQLTVSGDGLRLIVRSGGNYLLPSTNYLTFRGVSP